MSWTCRPIRGCAPASAGSSAVSVVAALVVSLVLVLSFSPILAIKNIQVEGNSLVKEKDLQRALEPLQGVPLARVGTGRVMDLLGGQPAVKDAIVQAEVPDTLRIQIIEHHPVAVLTEGSKRSLVGPEGQVLAVLGAKDKPKLPTVKANAVIKNPKVFSMLTQGSLRTTGYTIGDRGSRNGHEQGLH